MLLLVLIALGKLVRRSNHLSYLGGSKPPPHIFFCIDNFGEFLTWKLGTSLSEEVMFKQSMFVPGRQADKQADRQIYM